jgi:hypothetical protein
MNGHIAKVSDLHYRTHKDVKIALFTQMSPCKIDEEIYTSYVKLEGLSRRARYLCHEDSASVENHFTYDKHLRKALTRLDKIISYFNSRYNVGLPVIELNCIEIRNSNLVNFKYKSAA